jgi:hypothetical protein
MADSSQPKVKMTKKARAAARRRLPGRTATGTPKTMPSSRTKPRAVDPGQNNPNNIGAKIIPPGTPSSLKET